LQCGLNHASHAQSYLILKFEDVFERPVEPVGPEMRAGDGIDQLCGDAYPVSALSY
jgi:hypothetical protein